jgi:hypothetical protein
MPHISSLLFLVLGHAAARVNYSNFPCSKYTCEQLKRSAGLTSNQVWAWETPYT